jgi:hypothetical protein
MWLIMFSTASIAMPSVGCGAGLVGKIDVDVSAL